MTQEEFFQRLNLKAVQVPGVAELRDVLTEQALEDMKIAHACLGLAIERLEDGAGGLIDTMAWEPGFVRTCLVLHREHMQAVGEVDDLLAEVLLDAIVGDDA